MKKLKKNLNPVAAFVQLKTELEGAQTFLAQLKALPSCYTCKGRLIDPDKLQPFCPDCVIDDSLPTRYNCPFFESLSDPDPEEVS